MKYEYNKIAKSEEEDFLSEVEAFTGEVEDFNFDDIDDDIDEMDDNAKKINDGMQLAMNTAIKNVMDSIFEELPVLADEDTTEEILQYIPDIYKELNESPQGGKFFRASTFVSTALSARSRKKQRTKENEFFYNIMQIGAAFELFHTSMLVHDDIIDGDLTRRERPATHVVVGKNQAILIGDALLVAADYAFLIALQELLRLELISLDAFTSALFCWNAMKRDVVLGQMADIKSEGEFDLKKAKTVKSIEKIGIKLQVIATHKTVSYTTSGPFIIGSIIGQNLTYPELAKSKEFDDKLDEQVDNGLEYQLVNDFGGMEKDVKRRKVTGFQVDMLRSLMKDDPKAYVLALSLITKGKMFTESDFDRLMKIFFKAMENC
jgi:geranylgeranyl pyrophosphate synthase